jgi:hypothetical protein
VDFAFDGAAATTDVDIVADGAGVSGTAVTTTPGDTHTVRLECASRNGDTWAVGGTVEQSTLEAGAVGDWSAVIVKDGSPQRIGIWVSDPKSDGIDCDGWLASIDLSTIDAENFEPVKSGSLVPPPAQSVSTAPSAAPSATAAYPAWYTGEREGAGILPAGGQATREFLAGSTFTVPEGWVNSGDTADFYSLFPDSPANAAEYAASGDLAEGMHVVPLASPYFICDAWEDNRGTAAEMVASLVANEELATSEPLDVAIGGLTGKQVDIRRDPDRTDTCPGDPPTFDLGDIRTRAILLDAPDGGVMVIFVGSLHSAGHEAFLAEAMPIIESLQFDLDP